MAKIGSENGQLAFDICTGTVEALKGPNGESVPKIMDPWTALPSRASQSDPPNQLAESVLHLRQTQSCAELRNKEAVVFGLGKDLVAQCGIVFQRITSRRMQRNQPGFSELGIPNMNDAVNEIHILAIQCEAFTDPHAGDHK
jgi:anaerobic glycerol-3-phosphate dehydrogenase